LTEPHLSDFFDAPPLVFVSGQLALSGGKIVPGGIVAQTRQCLDNLASILDTLGLGLTDVVKTTVWLRSANDFVNFNAEYADVFGDHRPARSTVVSELVLGDALIEIEAVACREIEAG
jgi:2-iminobutanoate/2-iminopropanoate deaminase